MQLLFFTVLIAGFAQVVYSALPVHLFPVDSRENSGVCSTQSLVNETTKEAIKLVIKNEVNPYLFDHHGPPCSCGGAGGWTRVAYLDMADPNQQCPSNWTLTTAPVRSCGRTSTTRFSCDSAFFSAKKHSYSKVCGRIHAYQQGATDAFDSSITFGRSTIDESYLDGISVTHGRVGFRQHIWSFAVALYEQDPSYVTRWNCECTNTDYSWPYQIPSFVNNNYFCNTGNSGPSFGSGVDYPDDPLWDGEGCGPSNACCQLNSPPWFCTSLQQPTSDDLELRLCLGEIIEEDVLVSFVDIYVQ